MKNISFVNKNTFFNYDISMILRIGLNMCRDAQTAVITRRAPIY